jgi:hypothetical protein
MRHQYFNNTPHLLMPQPGFLRFLKATLPATKSVKRPKKPGKGSPDFTGGPPDLFKFHLDLTRSSPDITEGPPDFIEGPPDFTRNSPRFLYVERLLCLAPNLSYDKRPGKK